MDVLLNLEGRSFVLHLDAHLHIQVHFLRSGLLVILATLIELRVVSILDEVATMMPITIVDASLHKVGIHIVLHEVFASEVNHRSCVASLIDDEEAGNACILRHLSIVCTKGGSNMDDTSTVFSSHVIARNNAECFCTLIDCFAVH